MVALVRDQLFDPADVDLRLLLRPQLGLAPDLFRDLFPGFAQRFIQRRRIDAQPLPLQQSALRQ